MPLEGIEKPPNTLSNPRVNPRLKSAGAQVGVDFTGKCDRAPNTMLYHRAMDYALQKGGPAVQNDLAEKLFYMYFTAGKYPNTDNLVQALGEVGLGEQECRDYLDSDENEVTIAKSARKYSSMGVSGVPFFFFNDEPAFSGAQPPSAFLKVFETV
mgnify:CR=1 FL=1|tara:strand:+ start:291 stop:755 length:465 start_codon:yes stop_codon:yes gene_type:complete